MTQVPRVSSFTMDNKREINNVGGIDVLSIRRRKPSPLMPATVQSVPPIQEQDIIVASAPDFETVVEDDVKLTVGTMAPDLSFLFGSGSTTITAPLLEDKRDEEECTCTGECSEEECAEDNAEEAQIEQVFEQGQIGLLEFSATDAPEPDDDSCDEHGECEEDGELEEDKRGEEAPADVEVRGASSNEVIVDEVDEEEDND